jgi:hypothetical protein
LGIGDWGFFWGKNKEKKQNLRVKVPHSELFSLGYFMV